MGKILKYIKKRIKKNQYNRELKKVKKKISKEFDESTSSIIYENYKKSKEIEYKNNYMIKKFSKLTLLNDYIKLKKISFYDIYNFLIENTEYKKNLEHIYFRYSDNNNNNNEIIRFIKDLRTCFDLFFINDMEDFLNYISIEKSYVHKKNYIIVFHIKVDIKLVHVFHDKIKF